MSRTLWNVFEHVPEKMKVQFMFQSFSLSKETVSLVSGPSLRHNIYMKQNNLWGTQHICFSCVRACDKLLARQQCCLTITRNVMTASLLNLLLLNFAIVEFGFFSRSGYISQAQWLVAMIGYILTQETQQQFQISVGPSTAHRVHSVPL